MSKNLPITDTESLERINRILTDASNQINLLAVNTAIIAENLKPNSGILVIAKELQTVYEQLKIASEMVIQISKK